MRKHYTKKYLSKMNLTLRDYIKDFFKVCKQKFNIHKNPQIYTRIIHKRHTSRRIINKTNNKYNRKTKTTSQQLSQQ